MQISIFLSLLQDAVKAELEKLVSIATIILNIFNDNKFNLWIIERIIDLNVQIKGQKAYGEWGRKFLQDLQRYI